MTLVVALLALASARRSAALAEARAEYLREERDRLESMREEHRVLQEKLEEAQRAAEGVGREYEAGAERERLMAELESERELRVAAQKRVEELWKDKVRCERGRETLLEEIGSERSQRLKVQDEVRRIREELVQVPESEGPTVIQDLRDASRTLWERLKSLE